ncbi:MAG: FGGY-family carbohydrate kinase, partial [Chitinophagaceae bacterium]
RLAEHFNENPVKYRSIEFVPGIVSTLQRRNLVVTDPAEKGLKQSLFTQRNLGDFTTYEEAYHQLMVDIVSQQYSSSQLVIKGTDVKRIFVDGGFSKNALYMNLLAMAFPEMEVYAASMAQGTAVGAALAIHKAWNKKPLPNNIIELKYYSISHDAFV